MKKNEIQIGEFYEYNWNSYRKEGFHDKFKLIVRVKSINKFSYRKGLLHFCRKVTYISIKCEVIMSNYTVFYPGNIINLDPKSLKTLGYDGDR